MAYVNSPDRYVPIGSHELHVLSDAPQPVWQDGHELFYVDRPDAIDGDNDPIWGSQVLVTTILTAPSHASLQSYQYWIESGWKAHPGTSRAVNRFGEKAIEEHEELSLALRALQKSSGRELTKTRRHMVQELGDNLFCAVAQASNSSAGIDEAMKNTLYRYVMGIRHIRYDSEDTRPIWRSRAARLATKPDLLTINDIDLLIKAGFEPTQSPAMNIYGPDERHEGISGHIENLFYLISGAYNAAEQQYAYGNDMRIEGGPLFMMPEDYRRLSGVVGELSATALLEVAYIARVAVGKCLATVAKENVRKISSRVQAGLVDKSDGKRPNALR